MMWIYLFSTYIPEKVKSYKWLLWERRMLWVCCKRSCHSLQDAYEAIRVFETTRTHMIEFKGMKS